MVFLFAYWFLSGTEETFFPISWYFFLTTKYLFVYALLPFSCLQYLWSSFIRNLAKRKSSCRCAARKPRSVMFWVSTINRWLTGPSWRTCGSQAISSVTLKIISMPFFTFLFLFI